MAPLQTHDSQTLKVFGLAPQAYSIAGSVGVSIAVAGAIAFSTGQQYNIAGSTQVSVTPQAELSVAYVMPSDVLTTIDTRGAIQFEGDGASAFGIAGSTRVEVTPAATAFTPTFGIEGVVNVGVAPAGTFGFTPPSSDEFVMSGQTSLSVVPSATFSFGAYIQGAIETNVLVGAAVRADAGTDILSSQTVTVTLDGRGSAPGEDITSYTWRQLSGTPVALLNANTSVARFVAPAVGGPLVFELTVTNAEGAVSTDSVQVLVSGTADAPVLIIGGSSMDNLFFVVPVTLTSAVAPGASFNVPYPQGIAQGDIAAGSGAALEVYGRDFTGLDVLAGASAATITWPGDAPYTLAAGLSFNVRIDLEGTLRDDDPVNAGLVSELITATQASRTAANQADSVASNTAGVVADFNALLAKLKAAGLMMPDA